MKPFHYNQDPLYAVAAAILNNKDCHESIDEAAKPNDPANLRRIISNHTELLRKAPDSKAKEFHRVAIANAKEKLKSLGETVEESVKSNQFASLLGKTVYHGSPGYPVKEVISSIDPHQTKKGSFSVEFESGVFDTLSGDELNDLMNGAEVFYKSYGGRSVIKLKEEEQLEEAKDYKLKSLSLAQLVARKKTLENQIGYLEDKQGFAPEELKAEFRAIDAEIESRKSMKEGDEGFYSQKMIKNQLQTIIRNANACLQMIEAGREFPEWAQSEIAVAEDGVVSVTEFMQSHNSVKEKTESLNEATPWGTPYKGNYENVFFLDDLSGNYKSFINLAKRGVAFQTAYVAHVNDVPKLPDNVKKYTWFIFDKPQSFDTALALVPMTSDSLYESVDQNFKMLMDYSSKLSQLIAMTGGASTPIGKMLIDELGATAKEKLAVVRSKLVYAEEEFNDLAADYSAKTSK